MIPCFPIERHDIDLFNVRNDVGALRAIHVFGGDPSTRVILYFLTGEPRPTVRDDPDHGWVVHFPLAHFEPTLDLLRQEAPVWLILSPPEQALLTTRPPYT